MVAVPAATPVTIPVPDPTVAITVLLLLHAPPVVASLSVVVWLTHAVVAPVIADGSAFTVTGFVDIHPLPVV